MTNTAIPVQVEASGRYGRAARRHFLLRDGITFLNHGSFGATPRPVFEAQDALRRELEAQPVRFFDRTRLQPRLRAAVGQLAEFLHAAPDQMAFVENATTGANAVLRSLELLPGDEVLVTDHGYPAVRNAAAYVCRRAGAKLVTAPLPFPLRGPADVVAAVAAALTPRTRLAVLDLITSPSAAILPIAELSARCHGIGAAVLVDAAHAAGMIDLDLPGLGADWVTGNAHKWLFAPKGCAFLWARDPAQPAIHPTVISHGLDQGFAAEFDWVGTRDVTAWLSIGAALDFHRAMGDKSLRRHNHELADQAAELLASAWATEIGVARSMRGAMAIVRVPDAPDADPAAAAALHDRLWQDHRIEVPVIPLAGRLWLRVSAQIYNAIEDYQRLAGVLRR
ncbi:MAG: aminotransferase class V-fold PLP-dependent enzyme [Dongiaceae bacterium]